MENDGSCTLTPRAAACRRKFLEAAREVFLDGGLEKASMQEIVKRSGGSLTTLYKYFGSKEGLFEAVLLEGSAEFHEKLEASLAALEEKDLRTYLETFARYFLEAVMDEDKVAFHRLIVAEGYRDGGTIGKLFYQHAVNRTQNLLVRALERHFPALEEKELTALMFLGMLKDPYHQRVLILGEPLTLSPEEKEAFIARVLDRFFYGIFPR